MACKCFVDVLGCFGSMVAGLLLCSLILNGAPLASIKASSGPGTPQLSQPMLRSVGGGESVENNQLFRCDIYLLCALGFALIGFVWGNAFKRWCDSAWRPAKTFRLFTRPQQLLLLVFLSNMKFVSLAWGISVPTRNASWRLFICSQFLKFASSLQNCSSH